MQLITSKLVNLLTANVYGLKNLYSNQELSELNAILRSLSLMQLSATPISLILLRKAFLFAHWRTSLTKSSIPSNGQEITSKVSLLSHLHNWITSFLEEKNSLLISRNSTDRILLPLEASFRLSISYTRLNQRTVTKLVSNWQSICSRMFSTSKFVSFWVPSLWTTSSKIQASCSGQV